MKRSFAWPLILVLLVSAGCTRSTIRTPTRPTETSAAEMFSTTFETTSESVDGIETTVSAGTVQSAALVGKYINNSAESMACKPQYRPYLALYADGTCIYYENYYEDCMTFHGTYTVSADSVALTLRDGDPDHPVRFTRSGGQLLLSADAKYGIFGGISRRGDAFIRTDETLTVQPAPQYASTAEHAAQILWNNTDKWLPSEDEPYAKPYYCFMELDWDGIPELVYCDIQGSGHYSYNRYFKIDVQNETVREIPHGSIRRAGYALPDDYFEVSADMDLRRELKLYRSGSTGETVYWGEDYERAYQGAYSLSYGFLHTSAGSVYEDYLFDSSVMTYQNGETENHYRKNGQTYNEDVELSESEFESQIQSLLSDYTDLHVQYRFVDILADENWDVTFNGMNGEGVKKLLVESYNAFSYDGYVKKQV